MFGFIVKKAQATVDNAIGQVFNAVLVAVPLFVAGGFGTAALLRYLDRTYGTDAAYLILACGFGVLSLVALLVMNARSPRSTPLDDEPEAASEPTEEPNFVEQLGSMSKTDRELLLSALTTAGPYAIPGLLRLIVRNLPLILAVLAAVFVMTRPDGSATGATEAAAGDAGTERSVPDAEPTLQAAE